MPWWGRWSCYVLWEWSRVAEILGAVGGFFLCRWLWPDYLWYPPVGLLALIVAQTAVRRWVPNPFQSIVFVPQDGRRYVVAGMVEGNEEPEPDETPVKAEATT